MFAASSSPIPSITANCSYVIVLIFTISIVSTLVTLLEEGTLEETLLEDETFGEEVFLLDVFREDVFLEDVFLLDVFLEDVFLEDVFRLEVSWEVAEDSIMPLVS
ncbi:MAG: hypothetical protein K0R90_1007 [Oscillospiraceae bacterium]|nr:hypothetical protein [Oscillospiraceae bacterium]